MVDPPSMNKIPFRILCGLVDFPNELQCFNQLVNGSVGISSIKSTWWCYTIFRSIDGHDLEDHICGPQIHEEKNKRKRELKGRDNNWLMVFHLQRLHSKNEWLLITLKWPVFGDPIVKVFPFSCSPQRFMSTCVFPKTCCHLPQDFLKLPPYFLRKKKQPTCEIQVSAKGLLILRSFKTSYDGHGCGSRLRKFNSKPHRREPGSCCWETQPEIRPKRTSWKLVVEIPLF